MTVEPVTITTYLVLVDFPPQSPEDFLFDPRPELDFAHKALANIRDACAEGRRITRRWRPGRVSVEFSDPDEAETCNEALEGIAHEYGIDYAAWRAQQNKEPK